MRRAHHLSGLLAALALAAGGCGQTPLSGSAPQGAAGASAQGGSGGAVGIAGASGVAGAGDPPRPTPGLDPGRVAMHRLNNTEYDNTIRDLLGLDLKLARTTFQSDEKGEFDNDADAFTINDARYEQYFNAAETLATMAFAAPALRARIVTCAPAGAADDTCAGEIVRAFGARAWRRPLTETEVKELVAVARFAAAEGQTFEQSIARVVWSLLASVHFLYRPELDPEPTSLVPHAVAPYELASRLSYLLWSTMPDARLFALAASDGLRSDASLSAEVERMLADPRSETFVESFAGQWLGIRDIRAHQVEPTAFPAWDESLRDAMAREASLYFSEFLHGDRSFATFFTADFNFVDARLAAHYGFSTAGLGAATVRVENATDHRRGYLGLAGVMMTTSLSYRTAPSIRGSWILDRILCAPPPPPPADIPALPVTPPPSSPEPKSIRQRLEEHNADPSCADCHKSIDGVGLGLEELDFVGRYRTTYSDGLAVDNRGVLDGVMFQGEVELAGLLARDPRFLQCASRKAMTYALSRALGTADAPHLSRVLAAWTLQGLTLKALLRELVLDDTFRFRRGEATP